MERGLDDFDGIVEIWKATIYYACLRMICAFLLEVCLHVCMGALLLSSCLLMSFMHDHCLLYFHHYLICISVAFFNCRISFYFSGKNAENSIVSPDSSEASPTQIKTKKLFVTGMEQITFLKWLFVSCLLLWTWTMKQEFITVVKNFFSWTMIYIHF